MSERIIYRTPNGIRITPYTPGQCIELEKMCSFYDKVYHRRVFTTGFPVPDEDMFLTYNIKKGFLRAWFPDYRIVDIKPDRRRPYYHNELNPDVKLRENQMEILNQIALSNDPELYVNVPTAFGKTFLGVVYAVTGKHRCMITCNSVKILDQWENTIDDITEGGRARVLRIQGAKCIDQIISGEINPNDYDFFLITPMSLTTYATSHSYMALRDMIDKLCISLRIVDEAHLQIAATVKVNAISNVPQTLYLSADATRGNTNAKRSFRDVFARTRFITMSDEELQKLKHVVAIFTTYDSSPTDADIHEIQGGPYKWSHFKYSKYEWRKQITQSKVVMLINEILEKTNYCPHYKILILLQEISHVDELTESLKSLYEGKLTVGRYHSKVSKEEKSETLASDVIVSIYGSFAVGVDVVNPEIRYVISTIPVDEVNSNQAAGRCRPIEGKTSFIWFLYDIGFPYCKHKMAKVSEYLTHSKIKDMFVRDLGKISDPVKFDKSTE